VILLKLCENGKTVVPKRDMSVQPPGEVKTYFLSSEELEKYRSMPKLKQKRTYHTWERDSKW